MAGIYMIRCRENGWYYIGGTEMDFDTRFSRHRTMLRRRKAPRLLQACYDLHGEEGFDFVPLHVCPEADVARLEREAIEKLKPDLNVYGARKARPRGHSADPGTWEIEDEYLTIVQMAERAGCCVQAIRKRIARGLTGSDLIAPPHAAARKPYERRK